MDLYEYQAKELFAKHGVPTQSGEVVTEAQAAGAAADRIGCPVVVKAQVKTGGRGKAGGVKLADSPADAEEKASAILGLDIKGHVVQKVLITGAADIAEEYYVSFLLDRANRNFLAMASVEGGMDIEEVAATKPEALAKVAIDPITGVDAAKAAEIVAEAKFPADVAEQVADVLVKLWDVFVKEDATLVEVNPLVKTPDGEVLALDGKVTLDDNAGFRHEWAEYEATQVRDVREAAAHDKGLQYVGLDGTVGIIANGAGLAMSTLDVVNQAGGKPANFLDIGGGANADVMAGALEVINNDPSVKAIFINIFGGITRGEEVANGIVEALSRVTIDSPIVIRLDGTNAEEGRAILQPHLSDKLQMQPTMLEAAAKVVELAGA